LLSVAGQLVAGPWHLYGPYGRQNTLVMIHSPLYYHLAALVAWPFYRAKLDFVSAALIGGRLLSILCLGLTLAVAYRLARLDGAQARAGWWSVFLFAALPVVGFQPYAVRPDMLGVALQTTGILWVISAVEGGDPKGRRLAAAYVAFGLALCVKLHFIASPIMCAGLLLWASARGRIAGRHLARALLAGSAVLFLMCGSEELATGGRMSQAVFDGAIQASRIHPADWMRVVTVSFGILSRSLGVIAVLSAVGCAGVRARAGLLGRVLALSGAALLCLVLLSAALPPDETTAGESVHRFLPWLGCAFLLIPACALVEPKTFARGRADIQLWVLCAAEAAVVLGLARASTGAWVNYALQAVLLVSILAARALARLCVGALPAGAAVSIPLAALVALVSAIRSTHQEAVLRAYDRFAVAEIVRKLGGSPTAFFFAGRPGWNRVHGRLDLVYDDWLYPAFESIHLAEPRSNWLRAALTRGAVHAVVTTSDSPRIDGLGQTLKDLGYVARFQLGPYFVWERRHGASTNR
jgi:hypothetical protein